MKWLVSTLLSWFTGGTLDRVLDTVDSRVDNETERQRIRAEVTRAYVSAQASLLAGRTWWFQLFFVVPLGLWFTAVVADSIFQFTWNVAALPAPLDTWAGWIVSSLFLVDGAKAVIGRMGR
ncbi:MAG: hypothetical protein KDJ55_13130 [Rhodobiaceae bacterium]|nr:hypothetical protein [Rhodobiaceae bacterium]MCC0012893.1 hypothetical protein [Rhodobiaceae bacterium]MCC0051073.1 hypothetical protein [Rhodobiaceae bacterium]MCC0060080.1 hypothetical protein [Rhodobiaceae bacterium]